MFLAQRPMLAHWVFVAVVFVLAGCNLDLKATRKPLDPKALSRVQELKARMTSSAPTAETARDLGEAYLEGGATFEAADAFRQAAELGDRSDRVEAGLAAAYLDLGYVKSAIEHLTACFRINRDNPSCLLTLAGLMESDGRKDALSEARRAYQRFLTIAPDHPRAAYARSMLDQLNASLGTDSSELPTPNDATPSPGNSAPPALAGHAHGTDGQEVGELKPFGLAIQKAMEAERTNDHVAAVAAYREALSLEPSDPTALAGLARALWLAQQTEEAIKVAETAYRNAPNDPEVRYVFGLIMLKSGRDPQSGLAAWKALLRDDPEYAARLDLKTSIAQLDRFRPGTPAHKGSSPQPTP